ncbi:ATP-binding cassette domain-containing protein [uncultured Shewanella sp.]|uniref:ATP-binding cassette domain-containing protein n=1 Tax=uncultured Shewanella sp. TaxID=173975 RepID=UPI00262E554E|nr:ATP-binding cassette domain-containing protein [uncultured Shewanella sp.]
MNLLELDGVSFRYHCDSDLVLNEVSLSIQEGECHCISGPTGSGKSSILNLIMGCLSRPFEGELHVAEDVVLGLVMQDPNVQFIRQSVGAEIAFALENLAVPYDLMVGRVQGALRRVGLYVSLDTPIEQLSLGQKYRLMIAAQLVYEPNVILLDEPWAQLDDTGVEELMSVLRRLKADNVSIVLVEHNPGVFDDVVDHFWQLQNGKLSPGCFQCASIPFTQAVCAPIGRSLLSLQPFDFCFEDQSPLFVCHEHLQLFEGEIVTLIGDNGAGKSSLLKSIAGIQSKVKGLPLKVLGKQPKLGVFGAELGLLLQRPNRQLFENTVLEEMQFSLKRFGLPLENADRVLAEMEMEDLRSHSPHTLSYGQQHLVALASLASMKPKIMLLDDPLAGLDQAFYCRVWQLLLRLSRQGTAILLSSHRLMSHMPVTRSWHLSGGLLHGEHLSGACITGMDSAHVG